MDLLMTVGANATPREAELLQVPATLEETGEPVLAMEACRRAGRAAQMPRLFASRWATTPI